MDKEKSKKYILISIGILVLIFVFSRKPSVSYVSDGKTKEKNIIKSKEQIVVELNKELNAINKFNNSLYQNSVDLILAERELFLAWGKLGARYKKSDTIEIKTIALKVLKKLPVLQSKEFPIMRKRYGKITGKILWENDIYVSTSGGKNEILNISGAIFASNMNIKNNVNEISSVLQKLRFKEVRYRWYKESDEFTYYRFDVPKDSQKF